MEAKNDQLQNIDPDLYTFSYDVKNNVNIMTHHSILNPIIVLKQYIIPLFKHIM